DVAVAALDDRRRSLRAQGSERPPARFRLRVEPREGDEVLVEELADRARGAAAPRAEDAQAEAAYLGEELPSAHEGDDQFLPEARHAVEEGPEPAVEDAEQPRRPLRDARHDHRPAGQDVDVPGEVAGLVDRDQAVGVRRAADLYPAGLDDVQIDVR